MNALLDLSDIEKLQKEIIKYPQASFETHHYFADGMYCREVLRPKGAVIVGKVHKKEHFYIITQGEVTISCADTRERVKAPRIFVCQPGTKRAVFAHEDSVCITVHRSDKKTLEEIESDLVEDDPDCMYLPGNTLKVKELT